LYLDGWMYRIPFCSLFCFSLFVLFLLLFLFLFLLFCLFSILCFQVCVLSKLKYSALHFRSLTLDIEWSCFCFFVYSWYPNSNSVSVSVSVSVSFFCAFLNSFPYFGGRFWYLSPYQSQAQSLDQTKTQTQAQTQSSVLVVDSVSSAGCKKRGNATMRQNATKWQKAECK